MEHERGGEESFRRLPAVLNRSLPPNLFHQAKLTAIVVNDNGA
jgi:hypothetical protein